MKIQGVIRSIKLAVSQTGMSRQVTLDIEGDSIFDELQEIARRKARLDIELNPQQLELGDVPEPIGSKR